MKHSDTVVIKRWIPILKEYERTKTKVTPRPFKFVRNLCDAHHIEVGWGHILIIDYIADGLPQVW